MEETKFFKCEVLEVAASSDDRVFETVWLVPNTTSLQLYLSGSTSVNLHPDIRYIKSLSVCFNDDIEILQLHQHLPQNFTSENTNFSYKYHPLFTLCTGDLLFLHYVWERWHVT